MQNWILACIFIACAIISGFALGVHHVVTFLFFLATAYMYGRMDGVTEEWKRNISEREKAEARRY